MLFRQLQTGRAYSREWEPTVAMGGLAPQLWPVQSSLGLLCRDSRGRYRFPSQLTLQKSLLAPFPK